MLEPFGPAAALIEELWWVLFWVLTVVFVLVVIGLVYASLHRRETIDLRARLRTDDRRAVRWVLIAGAAVPAVVLVAFFVYTLGVLTALRPSEPADLVIDVTGLDWWWRVEYRVPDSLAAVPPGAEPRPRGGVTPEADAVDEGRRVAGDVPEDVAIVETANEIHVPVGAEVELRLRSADVIHSFWVPQLAGKMDLVPGRLNVLRIRADSAGVFRGQCAEYCGVQHTNMGMLVIAHPPDEFRDWLRGQAEEASGVGLQATGVGLQAPGIGDPSADPKDRAPDLGIQVPVGPGLDTPAEAARPAGLPAAPGVPRGRVRPDALVEMGRAVFMRSACRACHTIRGTIASSDYGPDLTHVGSRRTIAALRLANTDGNMAGWIANPQQIKPGANMPSVPLEPLELRAVTAYMMSLR